MKSGCRVIGVDSLYYNNGHSLLSYAGNSKFEFHREDVQDAAIIARLASRADVVILLAAIVGAPACEKDEHAVKLAISVNSSSVGKLVGRLSNSQRVLYPNTNSGYGLTDGQKACTEEDPLKPISVYGKSKCEGEEYVLDHPNAVSLRLATVFGISPRMRFDLMVNDFTSQLWDRTKYYRPFTIYEPHFMRNFVGVYDVARAFLFMMGRDWLKGVYNLGHPEANMSKLDLAHSICDQLALEHSCIKIGEGRDPDRRNYLVSNDKVLKTGFTFEHTLWDGIHDLCVACSMLSHEQKGGMRNV